MNPVSVHTITLKDDNQLLGEVVVKGSIPKIQLKNDALATDEQKTNGLDIADFLLMTETPQMALQRLIKQHPPLQHLIDSLGLVLVEEP